MSNIRYANENVKPLKLATAAGQPFYEATKETLINQTYPLTRLIPAIIDREPGLPIDRKVKEFLRYIMSREGQEAINRDGRYLPLNAESIAAESRKLD